MPVTPLLLVAFTLTHQASSSPEAPAAEASEAPAADAADAEAPASETSADDGPPVAAPSPAVPPAAPPAPEPEPPPGTEPIRVAVTDLSLSDVDEKVARVVYESLLAELRKLSRASVIGMDEIRAMLDLEAQKQAVGCESDESCLADIAGALGADVLVIGTLAKVGEQHVFGLRRIDQRSASVAGGVSKQMAAGNGEEFLGAIGPAVLELFPHRPLRPGATRGVTKEAAKRLNPPPLQPWVFWTTTAGAGTAAVVGSALAVTGVVAWLDFRRLAETAKTEPVAAADLGVRQTVSQASYIGAGAFGVVAVGMGTMAAVQSLFTDWEGLADEE
jgi:hypothetical protein